jgi:hypothetical protein
MLIAAITMLVTVRLAVNDVEGVKALRAPLTGLIREALVRVEVDQRQGTCSERA